jgi:hypothetical protein
MAADVLFYSSITLRVRGKQEDSSAKPDLNIGSSWFKKEKLKRNN